MSPVQNAVLLTGERETGKTTLCLKIAGEISGAGGIVCPAVFDGDGIKTGFRCVAVSTGASWDLGTAIPEPGRDGAPVEQSTGKYLFSETGILQGIASIRESLEKGEGTTIIDEIGPLELFGGGGFAPVLPLLAASGGLLIVVRPGLVDEVIGLLPDHHTRCFHLTELNREKLSGEIVTFLENREGPEGSS